MSGKFSATLENQKTKKIPVPTPQPSAILHSDIPQISVKASELPSKGIAYPPNSVIQYRPYTFGEIKKVSQSKLDVKSSFDFVLKGIETPFDSMLLTVGDFFYLGLLRRLSTLGSDKMIIPYQCNGCKKISKHITETTNIEFDDISAPELPIIAEFGDSEIEFNPLTLGGLYELVTIDKHSDEIALLAKQCKMPFDDAYKFIYDANPEESLLINEVDKLLYHSVKELVFECKEELANGKVCKHENTIELDGGQALIMPFREREEPIRSKIHFGKSNAHKSR